MRVQTATRAYNTKALLLKANAAMAAGDTEGFLAFCADDSEWTFVGERSLKGKQAIREWIAATYAKPPVFTVARMIAEGPDLVALGDIAITGKDGITRKYSYCDVWHFHEGKMRELHAFVVEEKAKAALENGGANAT